ncbi:hypothetical protein HYH03_006199 [Edaphochlamys debaryana]|uniref:Photolyase/cryptochrome alpha/beta domain-containing protein n=1 Tax=Edaphochlamys debaryana TaxID=47281 RepID=A0A835Y5N0_9CHLO|nr:hypothetical protein HYH03_006199 [Edaphochlamys debaryana]|eukprot:KAG2495599.1 hypothetical protein HYH03_006199 [Edaphochlamys debaryana]
MPATRCSARTVSSCGVWWIRRDLRLADNEALRGASQADALLPVYCLDPAAVLHRRTQSSHGGLGIPRLGPWRARLLLQSLASLHTDLARLQGAAGGPQPPPPPPPPPAAAPHAGQGGPTGAGAVPPGGAGEGPQARAQAGSGAAGGGVVAGGVGAGGGGGGGLVFRAGPAHEVLPGLLEGVLGANPQLRHVALHLHAEPLGGAGGAGAEAGAEAHVAGALREWAERHGLSLSVVKHWDRTLYHPDDLPYSLYEGHTAEQPAAASRPDLPDLQDPAWYRHLPPTMTRFRKATQPACPVRPSHPPPLWLPPLPAPFGGTPSEANLAHRTELNGAAAAGGGRTPPSSSPSSAVAAGPHEASDSSHVGRIPCTVRQLYEHVPGAASALERLQELTGRQYGAVVDDHVGAATASPGPHSAFPFAAGEAEALRRLRHYVWGPGGAAGADTGAGAGPGVASSSAGAGTGEAAAGPGSEQEPATPPPLASYTNTRALAVGLDASTKLSPFLALGCITPRTVHREVESARAAAGPGSPLSAECDWLQMHLLIRDYFTLSAIREGAQLFSDGDGGGEAGWSHDLSAFRRWASGRTGLPFVDASLRELGGSGWTSNRGRQNAASMLTKDLRLDWRWGAELFECLLLDGDEAVNAANWRSVAGVGSAQGPDDRRFKTVTQGMEYDPDAVLAATWLPELAALPAHLRHQPWAATEQERGQYALYGMYDSTPYGSRGPAVDGADAAGDSAAGYPPPMVDPATHVGVVKGQQGGGGRQAQGGETGRPKSGAAGGRRRGNRAKAAPQEAAGAAGADSPRSVEA